MKNTPYQPGELDQKIYFYRDIEIDDGYAGKDTIPTQIAWCWAKIKPGKPNESFISEAVRGVEQVSFIIRNRTDLLESDAVHWRGKVFNIRGIPSVNPRDMYLEILAERGVGV